MSKERRKEEMMREEEAGMTAIRHAIGAVLPMVLKTAVELDLFQLIKESDAAAGLSASELAAKLDRILRLLAAHSILSCSLHDGGGERRYALSQVGKFFAKNDDGPSCCASTLMIQDKDLMESWGFDEGIKTVVDVGGETGRRSTSSSPTAQPLRESTLTYPMSFNMLHLIHGNHISGDMFVSVLKGDIIFMNWVMHDWGDAECLKIMRNCKEALPENGKVVIVDSILPEIPESGVVGACVEERDVMMLAFNPGAKERAEMEFRALAKEAGFKEFRKVCTACAMWVIELYK